MRSNGTHSYIICILPFNLISAVWFDFQTQYVFLKTRDKIVKISNFWKYNLFAEY